MVPEKSCSSFGFCPNYLPPPPNHKFGQHVQLFSDIEIQDLRVSLGLKILDNLCNIQYILNIQSYHYQNLVRIESKCSQNEVRMLSEIAMQCNDDHATMRESNFVCFFDNRLRRELLVSLIYHQNWHPTAKLDPIG